MASTTRPQPKRRKTTIDDDVATTTTTTTTSSRDDMHIDTPLSPPLVPVTTPRTPSTPLMKFVNPAIEGHGGGRAQAIIREDVVDDGFCTSSSTNSSVVGGVSTPNSSRPFKMGSDDEDDNEEERASTTSSRDSYTSNNVLNYDTPLPEMVNGGSTLTLSHTTRNMLMDFLNRVSNSCKLKKDPGAVKQNATETGTKLADATQIVFGFTFPQSSTLDNVNTVELCGFNANNPTMFIHDNNNSSGRHENRFNVINKAGNYNTIQIFAASCQIASTVSCFHTCVLTNLPLPSPRDAPIFEDKQLVHSDKIPIPPGVPTTNDNGDDDETDDNALPPLFYIEPISATDPTPKDECIYIFDVAHFTTLLNAVNIADDGFVKIHFTPTNIYFQYANGQTTMPRETLADGDTINISDYIHNFKTIQKSLAILIPGFNPANILTIHALENAAIKTTNVSFKVLGNNKQKKPYVIRLKFDGVSTGITTTHDFELDPLYNNRQNHATLIEEHRYLWSCVTLALQPFYHKFNTGGKGQHSCSIGFTNNVGALYIALDTKLDNMYIQSYWMVAPIVVDD